MELQYSAENEERTVLTLGFHWLPCCVRDTAWSWFLFCFISQKRMIVRDTNKVLKYDAIVKLYNCNIRGVDVIDLLNTALYSPMLLLYCDWSINDIRHCHIVLESYSNRFAWRFIMFLWKTKLKTYMFLYCNTFIVY